jgi:peroxiredoxin Q/BCP
VAGAYGVLHESGNFALRWTFFIDKEGTIVHIDKEVKAASAGADLVGKLQTLSFPKK